MLHATTHSEPPNYKHVLHQLTARPIVSSHYKHSLQIQSIKESKGGIVLTVQSLLHLQSLCIIIPRVNIGLNKVGRRLHWSNSRLKSILLCHCKHYKHVLHQLTARPMVSSHYKHSLQIQCIKESKGGIVLTVQSLLHLQSLCIVIPRVNIGLNKVGRRLHWSTSRLKSILLCHCKHYEQNIYVSSTDLNGGQKMPSNLLTNSPIIIIVCVQHSLQSCHRCPIVQACCHLQQPYTEIFCSTKRLKKLLVSESVNTYSIQPISDCFA